MLYICMSVAGTIPVIVCLVLWAVQRKNYNFRLGKKLLLIGMFFYLVPFQIIKYLLPEQALFMGSGPTDIYDKQNLFTVISVNSITSPKDTVWIPMWVTVLIIIWLWCVILFALYQVLRYRFDIRKLLAKAEKASVDVNGKTVELYLHKNIRTPYTVGFFKPVIIVPADSLGHPCFPMIYRHEEIHEKNRDSLMKLICIIIICIHWFNPIAVLLLLLYNQTAEYICDALAGEGRTNEEKKQYLSLLIDLSTADEPLSMVWRNHLTGSENLMKRRINYMMKKTKTGLLRRGMAVVVSVVTIAASASTIFAYEPLMSAYECEDGVFEGGDFGSFSDDIGNINADDYDFSKSDRIFIDENGIQSPVMDQSSTYALCNHTLKSGYYSIHKPGSSGSCKVEVYYAQKCTKCGYLKLGSLYSTTTYTVCPH